MDRKVMPYEGNEPFIFVSYCHRDEDFVYPMIQNLTANGYRVWFDDGIHTGDDWLETIAQHLNRCGVCVAVVSEAASSSHNFRNEINYALMQKKLLLPIVHTQFEMSPGMRLLIGSTQFIREYDYNMSRREEAEAFFKKLLDSDPCRVCRDKSYAGRPLRIAARKPPEPQRVIIHVDEEGEPVTDPKRAAKTITRVTDPAGRINEQEKLIKKSASRSGLLILIRTGRSFRLPAVARIGRDASNEVCLPDKTVGRRHALISLEGAEATTVTDLDSTNGTYIFGERLAKGDTAFLHDGTIVSFARQHCLYLENERAAAALSSGRCAALECLDTEEFIGVEDGFVLGRDNPWPNGTFGEEDPEYKCLSHDHGHFQQVEGGFAFVAGRSTNGTYYNGALLEPGCATEPLNDGDEINAAGKRRIRFYAIRLKENDHEEE